MEWSVADLMSSPSWAPALLCTIMVLCLLFMLLLHKRDKEDERLLVSGLVAVAVALFMLTWPHPVKISTLIKGVTDLWWLWLLLTGIGIGIVGTVTIIKHECRPVATCDGYEVDPEKSHPLHLAWVTWPFWLLALLSLLLLLGILGYYLCLWLFSTQRDRGEVLPQIL